MIKYDKDENFHLDVHEVKSLLKEMLGMYLEILINKE